MDHLAIKHGDDAIAQRASLRKLTPKNAIIVEIGSYVGITAISLLGDDRKIFCIDPWSDEKYASAGGGEYNRGWLIVFSTFCQNCGNNLFTNIFPIRCKSEEIAPYFNLPIDLIYVDGNHIYEAVVQDIKLWWPKIKIGGYMVFDDYGSPAFGVTQAVDKYFPDAIVPFFGHKMIQKTELNKDLND